MIIKFAIIARVSMCVRNEIIHVRYELNIFIPEMVR